MAFCPKCGKEVTEEAKFCTSCGAKLAEEAKTEEGKQEASSSETKLDMDELEDTIKEKAQELLNTADCTTEFDAADIETNKLLSILSYIGILWLIPLLVAPKSGFARFHVNQGLVLWIANILVGFLAVIPILGWIAAFVCGIISFILMILGIINAAQGIAKELPIIGKFKLLK
jgi:uncharacterized membrane protein